MYCVNLQLGAMHAALLFVSGMAAAPGSKAVADFAAAGTGSQWVSINDGVMGGVSEGGFQITEGKTLSFSGRLSLKNRGGFASIRTKPEDLGLDGFDVISTRVKGDGRTYYLDLRSSTNFGAASYRAPIRTEEDTWQEFRIPLRDFTYSAFGVPVADAEPIAAGDIRSVGFTLADKKAGPFRLVIASITAEKADLATGTPARANPESDPGSRDIVDTAVAAGTFKTLVQAVTAAGLVEALKGPGSLTVFAPTDEAFAKLPKGTLESLLKPENRDKLTSILTYHVVPGKILLAGQSLETLDGRALSIRSSGVTEVNGVKVIAADIAAANGVIHVIDTVLIPPARKITPAQSARAVIELAIERGVPLFNDGQHAACAAVYEVTVESLLKSHADALDAQDRTTLQQALDKMKSEKDKPREQAWTLRRAMDSVCASLAER